MAVPPVCFACILYSILTLVLQFICIAQPQYVDFSCIRRVLSIHDSRLVELFQTSDLGEVKVNGSWAIIHIFEILLLVSVDDSMRSYLLEIEMCINRFFLFMAAILKFINLIYKFLNWNCAPCYYVLVSCYFLFLLQLLKCFLWFISRGQTMLIDQAITYLIISIHYVRDLNHRLSCLLLSFYFALFWNDLEVLIGDKIIAR